MDEIRNLKEEIEELENIEDVEEDVSTSADLFSISSYGVDYPVETLVGRMRKNTFFIPHFQRKYVWSQNQASRFIESLLLGLPVPGIFLFKETEAGRHLVIDGQQRLKSLQYFFDGIINGREFRLTGLETEWNNKAYGSLSDSDQARLDDAVVHATVFKQDLPQGEMNSVYEVFERINTGGVKLSPQEIRSCIFHGRFNEFLHDLNEHEGWRIIYGPKSKRLKDVEVILRFFAFFENVDHYGSPMKHFLNDYMEDRRNLSEEDSEYLRNIFVSTIAFIRESIGDRPFRPDRSLNTAVFDAVATAIAHRLQRGDFLDPAEAKTAYESLFENDAFVDGYIRSTADAENVKRRVNEARAVFGLQ